MKIAYKEFGKGKPLVILHGLFGSSDNWQSIGKQLGERFHVFIPDQRNHGDSFHSDTFTYDAMAGDLKEFLEKHGIERPALIGHSMGGKTVMKFCVNHPDLFDKAIVVDIGPKAYPVTHEDLLQAMQSLDLSKIETRQEAEDELSRSVSSKGVRLFLLKNLKRENGGYAWKLNLPVIGKNLANVGEGLENKTYTDKPFLFIRGEKSDYIQDQDSISIVSLFPNSNIVTVPGAGHWVHAENPEGFLKEVRKFLQGN